MMGVKGCVGGHVRRGEKPGGQPGGAVETVWLETERSRRNARCSGEMQSYRAELRLRRQPTGSGLTLRHESVGIEQD